MTPFFPDDGGKTIQDLFDRVFGTPEGEAALGEARAASRALRSRLVDAKAASSAQALETLRKAILA